MARILPTVFSGEFMWTPEASALAEHMWECRATYLQIAEAIGTTRGAVSGYLGRRGFKRKNATVETMDLVPIEPEAVAAPMLALPPPLPKPLRIGRANACVTPDVIYLSGPIVAPPIAPPSSLSAETREWLAPVLGEFVLRFNDPTVLKDINDFMRDLYHIRQYAALKHGITKPCPVMLIGDHVVPREEMRSP